MAGEGIAFQIDKRDNVATVLAEVSAGSTVQLTGDTTVYCCVAATDIPAGHKISLCKIAQGAPIVKYGVTIGCATTDIPAESWVHLHVMQSVYDERSGHLDTKTGAPMDTRYE